MVLEVQESRNDEPLDSGLALQDTAKQQEQPGCGNDEVCNTCAAHPAERYYYIGNQARFTTKG